MTKKPQGRGAKSRATQPISKKAAGRTTVRTARTRQGLQRSASADWHVQFGELEARRNGEAAFREESSAAFRAAHAAHASVAAASGGEQVQALIGIRWTDPTFPIFYDVIVNGVPIDPPNSAIGGKAIRAVNLIRGQSNAIDWLIHHEAQGWHNKVFLKLDGQVLLLGEDSDKSSADTDDISTGMSDVPVA